MPPLAAAPGFWRNGRGDGRIGIGLNIKNEATCRLAEEFVRLTGETKTKALEKRLDRQFQGRNRAGVAEWLMEIGRRCASQPTLDTWTPEGILYDKHGLPK